MDKNTLHLTPEVRKLVFSNLLLAFILFFCWEGNAQTYSYTGSVQTLTLAPGTYEIEMWGGNGGDGGGSTVSVSGGKGGYSKGLYTVTAPTTLNIYVGGKGETSNASGANMSSAAGGWNDGGDGWSGSSNTSYRGGGGGASDIRVGGTALTDRIIVAAGGGGASGSSGTTYIGED